MASVWRSKPTTGKSSSVALCRISPWRGFSQAGVRGSGGRLTPGPSTGDRMLAVRSSRSDGAGLRTRPRRFDLDRLRPDQGQGTGRPAASSCGLFGRVYREHWLGHCLSDYVPRSVVSDQCCSPTRPTDHRRDPDQPYPQHRHDGPAHPLCRRCRAVGGRATRPRKAEHLHNDLTIKSMDGSVSLSKHSRAAKGASRRSSGDSAIRKVCSLRRRFSQTDQQHLGGLEARTLALQRLGRVSSPRDRRVALTLQVASHRIVEDLHRREIVVDLEVVTNRIAWARRGGRTDCNGGSIVFANRTRCVSPAILSKLIRAFRYWSAPNWS